MLLPQSFYNRDALDVAYDLIGAIIRYNDVALRITEVEAYHHNDSASHCFRGKTERNAPLWGPPGHAYIYLCYGVHNMVNISVDREGVGAGVLIRSASILEGEELILQRRKKDRVTPELLAGPGKVGQALSVTRAASHISFYTTGALEIHQGEPVKRFCVGPRIGIGYATPEDQALPWRIADAESKAVSHSRALCTHVTRA